MKSLLAPALALCTGLGLPALGGPIVIHEIMYHPAPAVPEDNGLEWVELRNPGTNAVELRGWSFTKGVSFTFSNSTVLPAGGYLVVAADVGKFAARYPGVLNVTGPWQGVLGNNGEEIALADATGNEQDAVAYASEGNWAQRGRGSVDRGHQGWQWSASHDGEGKSLELINASLSHQHGRNWGASVPDGGTPGAANSIASTNLAPLIFEVKHTPAVPRATDPVRITARILDESTNGLAVTVYYRVDALAQTLNFSGVPMFDDGQHNDGGARDGLFGATLPAQTNNAVVEFYLQAFDAGARSRTYPAPVAPTGLQSANLLYQVDDTVPYAGNQPVYRLVMTQAEQRELDDIGRGAGGAGESDAEMNGTFIAIDGTGTEVRYTCGFRNRGHGSRTSRPNNFRVNIPNDARWHGFRHLNLNSQFTHVQVFGSAVFQKAGLPMANSKPVQLRVNNVNLANAGLRQFGSYAHSEELGAEFAQEHFPLDAGGDVYRGVRDESAPLAFAHLNYLGPDKTNCLDSAHDCYTNLYFKQSNLSEDRWDALIETCRVLGETPDAPYASEVRRVFDVETALLYFGANTLADNRETALSNGAGDDYALYIPGLDRRLKLLAYDTDTIIGQGDTPGTTNASLFRMTNFFSGTAPGPTNMIRFITHPEFTPLYYRTLKRLAEETFAATNFNPMLDRVLGDWVPGATLDAMRAWQAGRSAYVLSQIPTNLSINPGLTVVSNYLRTTSATLTLDGRANIIETRSVHVNGSRADWNHLNGRWTNTVTLQPGINRVLVQSFDPAGQEFERATVDVWLDNAPFNDVSGTIAGDTTWTAAAGPYRVTANLTVPAGRTLTVEAGTTVHFAPGVGMTVNGRLVAIGSDTQRIRFTRAPGVGATNNWVGLTFSNSSETNRLAYVDIESAGSVNHSIGVTAATLVADHLTFSGTTRGLIELSNASLQVSDSVFPTIAGAEHIHGGPMPADGFVIIERNIFGLTTGLNDIIDFTGAQRPGPILQILDNVFTGASDDVLDLDGTDAHIEGNSFLHVHKQNPNLGDTSSAISFGQDSGYGPHIVAVRNLFYDVDHVALAKEGGYITLINNTAVGISIAVVNFSEPERNTVPGAGALLDGNIFWNPPGWSGTNIQNRFPTNGSPQLTMTRCILPANDSLLEGPGNMVTNPRLALTDTNAVTWQNITNAFQLLAGSPALGTGPNGIDRGGLVPPGASIFGIPFSPSPRSLAALVVGGPSISNYIWRVDGGPWSTERPVATPIVITGLGNGTHFVEVLGRNDAGVWQATPTVSRSWSVDSNASRVRLNEVLAWNRSAFIHQDTTPDVIELYNDSSRSVALGGYGFSDDAANKFKYTFPSNAFIPAGEYLVFYADSETTPGDHTGFGLDQNGDTVFLHDPAGVLVDSVTFGVQLPDLSISRQQDGGWGLSVPTPGAANMPARTGEARRLKINEWLAASGDWYPDDFIELFNTDTLPVDMGGLYLTDAPYGSPNLSRLPPLSFIAASGFQTFLADRQPERGGNHVNFKLSPVQGAIALLDTNLSLIDCVFYRSAVTDVSEGRQPSGAGSITMFPTPTPGAPNPAVTLGCTITTTQIPLVPFSQSWRYDASGQNLGTAWRGAGYADNTWSNGQALLALESTAYPEPFRTTLRLTNSAGVFVTNFYFRTHFTVSSNLSAYSIQATCYIDDGAAFFLNGTEVARVRLAANATATTFAGNGPNPEGTSDSFVIPASSLQIGDNVLAVEVHQSAANSSDIVFGMALNAVQSVTNCVSLSLVLNEVMAKNLSFTNAPDTNALDWIELFNPTASTIELSDLSLSDTLEQPRRWIFPAGTTLAAGGYLVVRCNGAAPASSNAAPVLNTGFSLDGDAGDEVYLFDSLARGGALMDSIVFGLQAADFALGRTTDGGGTWALTLPTPGGPNIIASLGSIASLRINEWMANPSGGNEDYFELFNASAQPVALGGLFLTDDLANNTQHRIQSLSFIGVRQRAFALFTADGDATRGANHANFRLAGSGEAIGLFNAAGTAIDSVIFGAQANGVSEGRFPDGAASITNFAGTPTPDAANVLPLQGIVISEVLTRSTAPLEDAIELQNLTALAVDVSNWWLSDSASEPRKFRLPAGSVIEPGGFVVFYEEQFNPIPGFFPSFALSSARGDEVYLSTGDAAGNATGYRAGVKFGATFEGVSFGRHLTSVGADFAAQSGRTFGADQPATLAEFRTGRGLPNAYPRVGPVVVNEIMYHPPGLGTNDNVPHEFIELRNLTSQPVTLFDASHPSNTWRLRDAVDFDFPSGVTLPANGFLLVVSFNPATNAPALADFQMRYGLSPAVTILGPYAGRLANEQENVELYRPDAPLPEGDADAGFVPFVLVDKVRYADTAPWPALADGNTNGIGYSLQRRSGGDYGNDPVNWFAGGPTPGAASGSPAAAVPVITSITAPHAVNVGASDTLMVTATGQAPLAWQWSFNGVPLAGATNALLFLPSMQAANAGVYAVLAVNAGGAASASTRVDLRSPPVIVQQPQSQALVVGATVVFSVSASGTAPLAYQWRKEGVVLGGATNQILVIPNAQMSHAGNYTVVITNVFGSVTSLVANLNVSLAPFIVSHPQGTNVYIGATVGFGVGAQGSAPLRYQWRFNGVNIPGATNASYVIASAQTANSGSYRVLVTNLVGSVLSSSATLQVSVPAGVTIAASDAIASEPGTDPGRFTIQRSGSSLAPLTVNLSITGTATPGADYLALPSTLTIAAGSSLASLTAMPIDDFLIEGPETIIVTIAPGVGYTPALPSSATVTLRDNDNLPPSVAITNPAHGALFTAPANILVGVSASDLGGFVAQVQIIQDETNILATFTNAPYVMTWSNPPPAVYTLRAVATDDLGATSEAAPVTFILNAPPTVSLTNPANGAAFLAPANVLLAAAAADADGSVTNVEFFQGASLLGSFASPPWRLTLTNLPAGDYSFAARAADNRGAITVSAPANVRVSVPSPGFADHFAARNIISGFTNFVTGNSQFYSRESGEPRHANKAGDHSGWLTWTAPASGACAIDTFGSGFDTVLAVYTNHPPTLQTVTNLVAVAFNDDADSRTVLSQVSFNAVAGVSYQIAVDAFAMGQGGSIILHLNQPNPAPQIFSPPQSQVVDQGANVSFSVTAGGSAPLAYRWQFNGAQILGATQATLLRTNVSPAAEGLYTAVVTNASGSVTSAPASLTVRALPVITQPPQPVVLDLGGTAQFIVSAIGHAPLAYQWRFNGAPIPGATNPAFARSNAQFTNGGSYSVTVLNSVGTANSQPADLIVRPLLLSGRLTNSAFRVNYQGTPGRAYALERASSLTNWSAVATNASPVVQGQVNDPGATGVVSRIYRLRAAP